MHKDSYENLWIYPEVKHGISLNFFCIELKLCTVVTLITKFHMSTVTFPWQNNGLVSSRCNPCSGSHNLMLYFRCV